MEKIWQIFARTLLVLFGLFIFLYGVDTLFLSSEPVAVMSDIFSLLQHKLRGVLALFLGSFFIDMATGGRVSGKFADASRAMRAAGTTALVLATLVVLRPSFTSCETIWCTLAFSLQFLFLFALVAVFFSTALSAIYVENRLWDRIEIWSGWLLVGVGAVIALILVAGATVGLLS